MRGSSVFVVGLSCVATACGNAGPDPTGGAGDTQTESDTAGDTEGPTTSTTGSGGAGGESTASTDSETAGDTGATTGAVPPDGPPPATNIQIYDVTIDQGSMLPVAIEGELVPGADRRKVILAGRNAIVRAFYRVEPGFERRGIFARLTLVHDDGTVDTFEDFKAAFSEDCGDRPLHECRYGAMNGGFMFWIPGEALKEGDEYGVELFETAPGHENDPSETSPVFPTGGGTMVMGVEDRYMTMRAVLIPFEHDVGEQCAEALDLNAPVREGESTTVGEYFRQRLMAHNPVVEVELIAHEPVSFSGSTGGSSELMNVIRQLRIDEQAPPSHYYYGVIDPCENHPGFGGVAQLGGPYKHRAENRIGWGVWQGLAATADTFAHEIGHEQGRRHIACGGEAGVDPSYPDHPEGDLESWGMNVIQDVALYGPSDHEYMSYCRNTWVSDWGWRLVFPWIEEISSWEQETDPAPPEPTLFGYVRADGRPTQWWIGDKYWDDADITAGHRLQFLVGDDIVATTPARLDPFERSRDYTIMAPIPAGATHAKRAIWTAPESTESVALGQAARFGGVR